MTKQATVPVMQDTDSSPSTRVGFQQRHIISLPPVTVHVSILPRTHHHSRWLGTHFVVFKTTHCRNAEQERGRSQPDTINSLILGSIPGISLELKPWDTNKQRGEVIYNGVEGKPEEQTGFLYRLWAEHQLSKKQKRTTTYREPTGQTGEKNVHQSCCLPQVRTNWQTTAHEVSKGRVHCRTIVDFGFKIMHFIKGGGYHVGNS